MKRRSKWTGSQRLVVTIVASGLMWMSRAEATPPTIGAVTGFSVDQRSDGRGILLFQIVGQVRAACTIASQPYANYAVDLGKRVIRVQGLGTCNIDPRGEDIAHVDRYQNQ